MAANYVFSERDYLALKRDHYTLQREMTNLRRSVARKTRNSSSGRLGPAQIKFRNDNAGTIPAYGVMRITGAKVGANNSGGFLTVDQPDSTYRWMYLVNGSIAIPPIDDNSPGFGWGSFLTSEALNIDRQFVLYDSGSGTPAYGEEWGPTASSWKLSKDRPGFFVFGGNITDSTITAALQLPPGEILVKNVTGSAIAAAGTGTATLYGGTALAEATLGMTLTVNNRTTVSWADGKFGMADLVNGKAYVSPQQT